MAKTQSKPIKPAAPAKTITLNIDAIGFHDLVDSIGTHIDDCDCHMSVAARALRDQDCDLDSACAHVIEYSAFSALERAREYLSKIVALMPAKEVARG